MKTACSALVALPLIAQLASAAEAVLPGTDLLTIELPLDEVVVEGLNQFCLRELAASRTASGSLATRLFQSKSLCCRHRPASRTLQSPDRRR